MRDVTINVTSHDVVRIASRDAVPDREMALGMVADVYVLGNADPRDPGEWHSPWAERLDFIAHDRPNKTVELAIVRSFVAEDNEDAAHIAACGDPSRDPELVELMETIAGAYVRDNTLEIARNDIDYVGCVTVVVISTPEHDVITKHYGLASIDIFALYDEG